MTKELIKRFLILIMAITCFACSSKYSAMTPDLKKQLHSEFISGNVVLDCLLTCRFTWTTASTEMTALYNAGKWQELSEKVMLLGYRHDLAYFFLGRSAEEMGYPDAALKYYQKAIYCYQEGIYSCSVTRTCNGLDLTTLIPSRLEIINNKKNPAINQPLSTTPDNNPSMNGNIDQNATKINTGKSALFEIPSNIKGPIPENVVIVDNGGCHSKNKLLSGINFDIKAEMPITEKNIKKMGYFSHSYGSMFDGSYNENAPYTFGPMYVTNSFDSEIKVTAVGDLNGDKQKDAVLIINTSDGGNSLETHICIIISKGSNYHVIQGKEWYYGYGIHEKSAEIKNGKVLINVLHLGPNDSKCCPKKKGTIEYQIKNDAIEHVKGP